MLLIKIEKEREREKEREIRKREIYFIRMKKRSIFLYV